MRFVFTLILMLPGVFLGQAWTNRYNGPANTVDQANSIVVDGSGNICVTGTSDGSGSYADYATIKYSSAGATLWTSRYNGPDNLYDYGSAVAADGDYIYVTGGSMNVNVYLDYLTVKYDAAGDTLWTARYNSAEDFDDNASAIAVDNAHNVYVAGYTTSSANGLNLMTVKYDAAGVQQWLRTYVTNEDDYPNAVTTDGNGYVYVIGASGDLYFETWDYVTVKYSAAGDSVWIARYNGPADGFDEARGIALDNSGNVYVTGGSAGAGTGPDYTTIKYNPSGDTAWTARYNGPGNAADWANAIAVDASGNVYVAGSSSGAGLNRDYATVKYDSQGNQQWVMRYEAVAGNDDEARAIALDSRGNVYVTGASVGSGTDADYATVAYDPAGNQRWAERYNGPGNNTDNGNAVAVDASDFVYVTGESFGSGTDFDYATLKYAGVGIEEATRNPAVSGRLLRVGPNPSVRSAAIGIRIPAPGRVSLELYDVSGKMVDVLIDGGEAAGTRQVGLDTRKLAGGVYFVKLTVRPDGRAGAHVETAKLIVAR